MNKKNVLKKLYFASFERSGGSVSVRSGDVEVSAKSGLTYFIDRIPETGRRVGVSERDLDVVDTGTHSRPIVFSKTLQGALDALARFCAAERSDAEAVLGKIRVGDIQNVAVA